MKRSERLAKLKKAERDAWEALRKADKAHDEVSSDELDAWLKALKVYTKAGDAWSDAHDQLNHALYGDRIPAKRVAPTSN